MGCRVWSLFPVGDSLGQGGQVLQAQKLCTTQNTVGQEYFYLDK